MSPFLILLIGIAVVVGGVLGLKLHPFLALVLGALAVGFATPAENLVQYGLHSGMDEASAETFAGKSTGVRVAEGFGSMAGKVGILIAMAAIIGKCLLDSGAADRIIRSALKILGEPRAPAAFAGSGFLLGIPVFFDTVFYLMIPLGKALAARTGKNYALYIMTMAAGATIAHSLVPPTPGPLMVAGELGVSVGAMMIVGLALGALAVIPGVLWAFYANRRWPIPLRESEDVSSEDIQRMAERDDSTLPPLWLSLLPIVLPIVIIGVEVYLSWRAGVKPDSGTKNLALVASAALALAMLWRYAKLDREKLSKSVQSALASGGVIILITSAGGAFGGVLKQTDIGFAIKDLLAGQSAGLIVLPLAFLATTLVRTAQGSATVAMATAGGMFAAFAGDLGFHPVYLAAAIGFGSKPFPWMNDSGFWVVCRMSGQTVGETIRNHSVMFCIMGVSGLILTVIAAALFPMVGP